MSVRFIFDAGNFIPTAGSFATFSVLSDGRRGVLSFADSAGSTFAYFETGAPSGWSGSIGASVLAFAASTVSGSVVWQLSVEAVTPNSDSTDMRSACSFATTASVAIGVSASAGGLFSASLAPDDDGAVAGDYLRFQLVRQSGHTSDTAACAIYLSKLIIADGR